MYETSAKGNKRVLSARLTDQVVFWMNVLDECTRTMQW